MEHIILCQNEILLWVLRKIHSTFIFAGSSTRKERANGVIFDKINDHKDRLQLMRRSIEVMTSDIAYVEFDFRSEFRILNLIFVTHVVLFFLITAKNSDFLNVRR